MHIYRLHITVHITKGKYVTNAVYGSTVDIDGQPQMPIGQSLQQIT